MAKIAFIGAGSLGFTRRLVRDLLTFELLQDAEIALMDIDAERLEFARRACESIVERGGYPAKITATLDRRQVLKGADAVLCTILAGDVRVWRHDIEIPMKYGVDTNVGDTRGPSGVFRALRTIPVMLDICRDMERYCPDAILLNYTNPMSMLCRVMQRASEVRVTGLCHSVQGTAMMLAGWIGAEMDRVTYVCAGINHQAWYLEFKVDGQDAYPLIHKAMRRKKVYEHELVRNEMFKALGYYVTESSGHNSEYNWWFRKRPDLIEKYCIHGTGWNPGEHGYILKEYLKREKDWKKEVREWFKKGAPIVTNLPDDVCVEVPVVANRRGFSPIHVGELPIQCAALNNVSVAVEEMAVEASFSGAPTLVYQAICYDPLTAAVLSLAEIKQMVRDMFRRNQKHLPQFQSISI